MADYHRDWSETPSASELRCLTRSFSGGAERRLLRTELESLSTVSHIAPHLGDDADGHDLAHATIGEQKKTNPYLRFSSLKQFLAAMGFR